MTHAGCMAGGKTIARRTEDLKHLNEKMPNLFDRILGANPDVYIDVMASAVYEVSKRDEGFVVGHCSQMLMRDFSY